MKVFKLDREHIEERTKWLNHSAIYKNMNLQYPITLRETEKWFERIADANGRMDLVFKNNEKITAMTGITNVDTTNGIAELYVMVNPSMHGMGIGSEVTKFTINYAFTNFNIHKIYLYTNAFNEKANKLYTNLAFFLEGTLRKHKFKNGEFIDRCVYGLLKEDWAATAHHKTEINLNSVE